MTKEASVNLRIRDPRAPKLAMDLAQRKNIPMTEAVIGALTSELQRIEAFLAAAKIEVIALDKATGGLAITAFARYGKGRGHPAQLNPADCLSYACAKRHAIALL